MDRPNNSGFTMVEVLLVMMMISILSVILGLPYIVSFKAVPDKASEVQLQAMVSQRTLPYKDGLSFNHRGNINQAKTLQIGQMTCVFQLGMGRYYCE